jgi:O-glycosyl hydrolase
MRNMRWIALLLFVAAAADLCAQRALVLPEAKSVGGAAADRFEFVSDGPAGAGWSRPDEIARHYFHENLPALFERTLSLDGAIAPHSSLRWIFTGPHAGVTVELSASKVRLSERYYDSFGYYEGQGNYPEKKVYDQERQFTGQARTLTVIADNHLGIRILVNGVEVLEAPMTFDLSRHQLMFVAPRAEHIVLSGKLLKPEAKSVTVTLASGEKHQTMIGFGGSPSLPAYFELSDAGKKIYWQTLKSYNLLLSREYPMGTELKQDLSNMDNLREATPHYYGNNFPNSEVSSFEYNRHVAAMGGDVIYELWALPKWATQPYSGPKVIDAWNKSIKQQAIAAEYARIVVNFCQKQKAATGIAPTIVGVQNEVEQPPAMFAEMTRVLRRELDKAGFATTRIHMADAPFMTMGTARVQELAKDPEAWKDFNYTAAHEYDFQEFAANPDMYDARLKAMREASKEKEFLATEICLNDAHLQERSYRVAFAAAQLYHKNLTILDAVGIMYCWLILDVEEPSFGGSRSLLVPDRTKGWTAVPSSFELRVLGAYSRHIAKGMKRVGASVEDSDLMTTAFADAKNETLVMINRGTVARSVKIEGATHAWTEMERTGSEEENAVSAVPANVTIEPGEIVVLSTIKAEPVQ